jgi:hypothetical protein
MPARNYKSVSLQVDTVDRLQRMAVRLSAVEERRLTLSEVVDRLIACAAEDMHDYRPAAEIVEAVVEALVDCDEEEPEHQVNIEWPEDDDSI